MIGYLRGRATWLHESEVVVDVGGVGYRVTVLPAAVSRFISGSEEVALHTHMHVREDALSLFGFATSDERDLFELLLGASGVGPKVALAILSVHSPRDLRRAVAAGDLDALVEVPGIGRKTAQKLLFDLRDKLGTADIEAVPDQSAGALADTRAALAGLGYGPAEIREAMAGLDTSGEPEELLREALRQLGEGMRSASL